MNRKIAVLLGGSLVAGWVVGQAQERPAQVLVESLPRVNARTFSIQEAPVFPKMPLPPDLLNVDRPLCTLDEYGVADSLDAKTGEITEITRWRVEPAATYTDHRPKWELPSEALPTNPAVKLPGSIADVATASEALEVCRTWMKAVNNAILKLRKANEARKSPSKEKP